MKKRSQKRILTRRLNFLLRVAAAQQIHKDEYSACENTPFVYRKFIEKSFCISYRTFSAWLSIPAVRDIKITTEKLERLSSGKDSDPDRLDLLN